MKASRLAAFCRTAVSRPLLSGTKLARTPNMKMVHDRAIDAKKFSAWASHVAAGRAEHSEQDQDGRFAMSERGANAQLELGLQFKGVNNRSAVLELELDELNEALESFLQRRSEAGEPVGEEALHAMADTLAERAKVLYFNELDTTRIQACPRLLAVFRRLEELSVLVICPPPLVPLRRTVGAALGASALQFSSADATPVLAELYSKHPEQRTVVASLAA
jgi:hypothetical protein